MAMTIDAATERNTEVHRLAVQALEACGNDLAEAMEWMRAAIWDNAELVEVLIRRACWDALTLAVRHERVRIIQAGTDADTLITLEPAEVVVPEAVKVAAGAEHQYAPPRAAYLRAVAAGRAATWYDYPLIIGGAVVRLGDARRAELEPVADHHRKLGVANLAMARFLTTVAATLPEGKRVREVLSEDELRALHARAREDAAR